jgi:asparagine synthase (glutamine-hydrolysing)
MSNKDATLWITFNGEIFNYVELREELLKRGHRFSTLSDTEVLLHLYEEEGPACVQKLNGQWAFGIWDVRRRKLFLSRDRLGVRPIFYYCRHGEFVFASEIKALFAEPSVPRNLDIQALDETFTFWFPLSPRTAFENIYELPPGHSLTLQDGKLEITRYWKSDYCPDPAGLRSEEDYTEELYALLDDAVRLRLRADVPTATYLSGGLDSSVVTAIAAKHAKSQLKSFSVTFDDAEFDESAYQREVVSHLATAHRTVHCTAADIAEVFPEVTWHTERPILRTAPAPLHLLSKLVRKEGFKVVLTGEGSDEMLGGYDIFKETKIRAFWSKYPDSRLRPLLLRRLYPYLRAIQNQPDAYRREFFHIGQEDLASPFFSHLPRWRTTVGTKLFFSDEVKHIAAGHNPLRELEQKLPEAYFGWDRFCQSQHLETAFLLPSYILSSQGDRVGMSHSVEIRLPFLDFRVVEFAGKLPVTLKMRALNEKYILKRCARNLIPESVRSRRKQPYRAPDGKSFLSGKPLPYVDELLSPERLREDGIFKKEAVQILRHKLSQGDAIGVKDNMAFVGILSTQLVMDRFIRRFDHYIPSPCLRPRLISTPSHVA